MGIDRLRLRIAMVVTPLLAPVVFILMNVTYNEFIGHVGTRDSIAVFCGFAFAFGVPIAALAMFALGWPYIAWLRRRGWLDAAHVCAGAGAIGALTFVTFACAMVHGPGFEAGIPRYALIGAFLGAVCGSLFCLIGMVGRESTAGCVTFGYVRIRNISTALSVIGSGICVLLIVASSQKPFDEWIGVVLFVCLAGIPMCLAGALAYRDVVVSSDGIARGFYGARGRLVRWSAVRGVFCVLNPDDATYANSYLIQTKRGSRFFGLHIFNWIDRRDELAELIREQVVARQWPISTWHGKSIVTLDVLPPLRPSDGCPT